jgi:hypothetical protein
MTRWYSGYVKKDGKVIYDVFEERSKIWDRIRRALRAKVQKDSLNMDDTILIHIQDASGYFQSCPEVLGGYVHEEGKVSDFI